jgi:hypothetical protein
MLPVPLVFTGTPEQLRAHARRDLLINLVLGGLYTSVARRHVADYLASHTSIGGTPVVLVPPPKSLWPVVVLALAFLALRLASEFGDGPPMPVVVIVGTLLVPYVWATAAARGIGAITWRGSRLSFEARWREIYLASWPLLVLGAAWAWVQPTLSALAEADTLPAPATLAKGVAAAALFGLPLLAGFAFNLRRLRFTRTRVDGAELAWTARFGAYLRACCVFALGMLVTAILPVVAVRYALLGSTSLEDMGTGQALAVYALAFTAVVLLSAPARAWFEARVFVLTWNGLRVGELARVTCALDARSYARMKTRDTWQTVLTFGRHRAPAIVKAYQARLAALALIPSVSS